MRATLCPERPIEPADRMIESAGVTLSMQCGNCNGPVHLPGAVQNLVCPHCAHQVAADWKGVGSDILKVAGKAGSKVGYTFFSAGAKGRFDAVRREPRCPECKGGVDLEGLSAEEPALTCEAGHPVSVRRANELGRKLMPGAVWLVGEGLVTEASRQADSSLRLLNCKACGGELEIQPGKRDLTCGYCSSLNVVSDEVWIRLHPELQPREFFVVATWGPEEALAHRYGLAVWHEKRPKKNRSPLIPSEGALAAQWPAPEQGGLDWLFGEMIPAHRELLAEQRDLDGAVALRLAEDPKVPVRERLAESKGLIAEAQALLARDPNANVRRTLAKRTDLALAAAEGLIESGDPKLIELLERQSALAVPVRLALARSGRPKTLRALRVEDCPAEQLPVLAAHGGDPEARVLVARHPEAPDGLIEGLGTDPAPEVRLALAERSGLPQSVVQTLFADGDPAVRKTVAGRDDLPTALRLELARTSPEHLETLLRGEDCPPEAFELGLASDSAAVHRAVLANEGAPEAVVVGLAGRISDSQAAGVLIRRERTAALREAMVRAPSRQLRQAVLGDPLDPAQLAELAEDEDLEIRRRLASRADLPGPVAIRLAADEDEAVAAAVVGHPAVVRGRWRRRLGIAVLALVGLGLLGCAGGVVAAGLGFAGGLSAILG